jgi:hypothetical protein
LEKLPTDRAIDDAIALEVAARNNRQCVAETEKLKALQDWVKLPLKTHGEDK